MTDGTLCAGPTAGERGSLLLLGAAALWSGRRHRRALADLAAAYR